MQQATHELYWERRCEGGREEARGGGGPPSLQRHRRGRGDLLGTHPRAFALAMVRSGRSTRASRPATAEFVV